MSGVFIEDNRESLIVRCECHTEAVQVSVDLEKPSAVYLSAWNYGDADDFGKRYAPWRRQLWAIWYILRRGSVWFDDIVLNSHKARELGKKLIEFADMIDQHDEKKPD